jgi:hypothetical protein
MPVLELDSLGTYWYEPDYCLRDALAQGLGPRHPLVQEVGRCGPNPNVYQQIKPILTWYGVQHWISQQAWP